MSARAIHRATPDRFRRASLRLPTCSIAFVLLSTPALAEPTPQDSREADIFGAGVETSSVPPASDRDEDVFGTSKSNRTTEKAPGAFEQAEAVLSETNDVLDIGGRMLLRLDYLAAEEGDPEEFALRSPNLVDVYLDARPNQRLRAYVRGRLKYDPTVSSDEPASFGAPRKELEALLDQLWLKFDIERAVFVTLGRQPIKWGSGRFWNPSDFVNQNARDPLAIIDERLGVNLLKLHVPVEALGWNFYAIATLDQVNAPEKVGGALRAELLLGPAEIALSTLVANDAPTRVAADISAGIWLFDFRVEATLINGIEAPFWRTAGGADPFVEVESYSREDDWIPQISGGAEVSWRYSDEDSVIVGAEYFYNDAGYGDSDLYTFLIYKGQFTPLYAGRHYAGGYVVFMNPGSWNNTTFLLNGIGNLSDRSFVARFDHQVEVLTYLRVNTYAAYHFGRRGEFHFDASIAPGAIAGLPEGLEVAAPLLDLGVGLTLSW